MLRYTHVLIAAATLAFTSQAYASGLKSAAQAASEMSYASVKNKRQKQALPSHFYENKTPTVADWFMFISNAYNHPVAFEYQHECDRMPLEFKLPNGGNTNLYRALQDISFALSDNSYPVTIALSHESDYRIVVDCNETL
jgi:hypothetical protein